METLTLGLLGLVLVATAAAVRRITASGRNKPHVAEMRTPVKPLARTPFTTNEAKMAARSVSAGMPWGAVSHGENPELTAVGQ